MIILFQLSMLILIALSFGLVIGVPLVCILPNGWVSNKKLVFSGATAWITMVFVVGFLNSFVA